MRQVVRDMLKLPTVTLLSIDVAYPFKAADAMIASMTWCKFRNAFLLTDVRKHKGLASHATKHGIQVVNHIQSNRTETLPGLSRKFFPDYEYAQMVEPNNYIGDSSHVLYMESDAGVLNPEAWNPFWYSYDYIGAPWPLCEEQGFPKCDGVTNAVGNGGFSLRSRKFCKLAVQCLKDNYADKKWILSDTWLCRTMRPWFEDRGVEFAPAEVAERFSCENRIYTGQFGYHGRSTARINGWNWPQ
jgi:hypothetical protein